MPSTTTFPAVPAHRPALPVRRHIAIYFLGGVDEIPGLVGLLPRMVHELSVDIHDGVRESSMVCTVMLPGDEVEELLAHLRDRPAVVSCELT